MPESRPATTPALFDRKAVTDEILLRLGVMEGVLKWHTSRGHNDHAKVAEDVVARFLSALCGWCLVNLNTVRPNYPAADLGDPARRLAIQVTVNGTADKVRETHEKAISHNLGADFDTLIILFLLEKSPSDPRKSSTFTPCTQPKIEKWAQPQINKWLDPQRDELLELHLGRLRRCLAVLQDEMTGITAILSAPVRATRHNLRYTSLGDLFVGRADTLLAIRYSLTSGHATALKGHAIHGMGGVGKTRAAIEYAWQFFANYAALLMVDADKPGDLDRTLAALCGRLVLDLPEQRAADQDAQRDAVLHWLQSQSGWLLIIDNADSAASLSEVRKLLPRLHHGHVLLTTRLTDVPPQFTSLPLDVLSQEASVAYLFASTNSSRTPAPDDETRATELADLLGHLVLALEQAAACIRVTRRSFADYIVYWQTCTTEAMHWYVEGKMDYPRSLAITHETSVAQLSEEAKALFRQLAWFAPDPIPFSILKSEHAPANARVLLAELENLHLATRREDGAAFTVHRLLQEITRQQQPEEKPAALLSSLTWIDDLIPFEADDVRTWPLVEPLVPHAIAIAHFADARHITAPTATLLSQIALFYDEKARHETAEPLMRRALILSEASMGKQHTHVAIRLNNLASLLQDTNRLAEAGTLLVRAVNIMDSNGGEPYPLYAAAIGNLAKLYKATNRLEEAETLARRSLDLLEASFGKSHPKLAIALNTLAMVLKDANRLPEAEPLMRRALLLSETSFGKDHPNVATDLNNLASLLQHTNRLAEAEPLMRRSIAIWEASLGGDHPTVATALNNLASLLQATNRLTEVEPLMRRALAIDEASFGENHPDVARDLNNLALLYYATNRLAEAEPLMRRMLGIFVDFTIQTEHPHPHLNDALENYRALLTEMGDTEAVIQEKLGQLLAPLRRE